MLCSMLRNIRTTPRTTRTTRRVVLVILAVVLVVLGVVLVVLGVVLVVLNIEQNIEHRTLFSDGYRGRSPPSERVTPSLFRPAG